MAPAADLAMKTITARGFTLIELMIALSIFAFLIIIAGPQYADFMGNMQIRNAAENTLTGLRLAQSEAVRGNTQAEFVLDTSAAGGWQVLRLNEDTNAFDPPAVQSYKWADGASRTQVVAGGLTKVTFNGLGRIMVSNPDDGSLPIVKIDITHPTIANARPLRVVISAATPSGVKLCDPDPRVASVDPNDPRICPAS
jgi:type IV fimbrial biogenesis protein FimT